MQATGPASVPPDSGAPARQAQADRSGIPVPGHRPSQRAADASPAHRDIARQRAQQYPEQFVIPGRAADQQHLG